MNIAEIVKNKADLIKLKKAEKKLADAWSSPSISNVSKSETIKADSDVINKTIIGNTYNWLDSHGDVHVKGCFTKSINENKRIFHLHDHEFKIGSQVGKMQKVYEKDILWKDLGVNKEGYTTSLMADTQILKELNTQIFKGYLKGEIDQHSVGMQYVKIDLAVKQRDDEWKEENDNWDEIYETIANKEQADNIGYIWIVREAKLIEISAVLMGSNSLTPTLQDKQKPLNDTSAFEPSTDTQAVSKMIQTLNINL